MKIVKEIKDWKIVESDIGFMAINSYDLELAQKQGLSLYQFVKRQNI